MNTPGRNQPTERIERMRPLLFWLGMSLSIGLSIALIEIKSPERLVRFQSLSAVQNPSEPVEIVLRETIQKSVETPKSSRPSAASEPDPFRSALDSLSGPEPEPGTDTSAVGAVDLPGETGDEIKDAYSVSRRVTFEQCGEEPDEDARYECFQTELQKHIRRHLVYPSNARELGLEGKVYVEFVVGKDGRIESVEIIRGVDPMLDKAAVEAIKTLPLLLPARNETLQPVRMRFTMPVAFKTRK